MVTENVNFFHLADGSWSQLSLSSARYRFLLSSCLRLSYRLACSLWTVAVWMTTIWKTCSWYVTGIQKGKAGMHGLFSSLCHATPTDTLFDQTLSGRKQTQSAMRPQRARAEELLDLWEELGHSVDSISTQRPSLCDIPRSDIAVVYASPGLSLLESLHADFDSGHTSLPSYRKWIWVPLPPRCQQHL